MALPGRVSALSWLVACAACVPAPRPLPRLPLTAVKVGAVEAYGPGLLATDAAGQSLTFEITSPASVVVARVWPGARIEPLYPARRGDTTRFAAGTHLVRVAAPEPWMAVASLSGNPFAGPDRDEGERRVERCFWTEVRRQSAAAPPPGPQATPDSAARLPLPREPDLATIEDGCREMVARGRRPLAADTAPLGIAPYFVVLVASDVPQDARRLRMKLAGMDIRASSTISVLQLLPGVLAGADARSWAAYVAYLR